MKEPLEKQVKSILTRKDFSKFVIALKKDLEVDLIGWENASLESFLEALAAWAEDMDGYYQIRNLDIPIQPSWELVAEMLLAAKTYE